MTNRTDDSNYDYYVSETAKLFSEAYYQEAMDRKFYGVTDDGWAFKVRS